MREPQLREVAAALGIKITEKTRTGWLHAPCPLAAWTHPNGMDRHPSFGMKVDGERASSFHCYTCKSHGRVGHLVHLLGQHSGQDLAEVAAMVDAHELELKPDFSPWGGRSGGAAPLTILEPAIFDGIYIPIRRSERGTSYLQSRGINGGCAERLGILWDGDEERVLFPVYTPDGGLLGFTGRAVDPGRQPKVRDYSGLPKRRAILGAERWQWDATRRGEFEARARGEHHPQRVKRGGGPHAHGGGGEEVAGSHGEPRHAVLEEHKEGRPLALVEGLFAYAWFHEIGLESYADVGALLGSWLHEEQLAILLRRRASIYWFVDNDPAGDDCLWGRVDKMTGKRSWKEGAILRCVEAGLPCYVPGWPVGKDDPDQLTKGEVWRMIRDTEFTGMRALERAGYKP